MQAPFFVFSISGAQYSIGRALTCVAVNTGPSLQTYTLPTLQRPHLPRPHFIRFSRVVKTLSSLKPSFSSTGSVYLIMIGGPHNRAMEFSDEGAASSRIVGTNPTLPSQVGLSPPGSTVFTKRTSDRSCHSFNSRLYTKSPSVRAPYTIVISPNLSRSSRQFQISVLSGGKAMPPATKTRFLP